LTYFKDIRYKFRSSLLNPEQQSTVMKDAEPWELHTWPEQLLVATS